jgi:hypothetical protein
MANTTESITSPIRVQYAPTFVLLRFWKWEIFFGRNYSTRCYRPNPLIDMNSGLEAGSTEILLLKRWLCIVSKAR